MMALANAADSKSASEPGENRLETDSLRVNSIDRVFTSLSRTLQTSDGLRQPGLFNRRNLLGDSALLTAIDRQGKLHSQSEHDSKARVSRGRACGKQSYLDPISQ